MRRLLTIVGFVSVVAGTAAGAPHQDAALSQAPTPLPVGGPSDRL